MRLLLMLLAWLPLIALGEAKVEITGTVADAIPGKVTLTVEKKYLADEESYEAKLNDGKFSFSFELDQARVANFSYNDQSLQLFLVPGDKLNLSFTDSFSAVDFSGEGAVTNKFLKEFNEKFQANFDDVQIDEAISASAIDEFEMKIFDNRQNQMTYYQEYPEAASLPEIFKSYIEDHILYQYYYALLKYALIKSGTEEQLKVNSLPNIMIEGMSKKAPLMKRDALISSAYRGYLRNYVAYHAGRSNNFQKFENHSDFLEKKYNYALRYLSEEPFTYFLATELYDYCGKASAATVQKINTALVESDPEGIYTGTIAKRCEEPLNAKIPKPKKVKVKKEKEKEPKAPKYDFKLVGLNGKNVSIDDFRGKVIYVDFWASWCGPCRQQFPHAKELKHMLTKDQLKQVVFLYISIDNTEDKWKGAIENFGLEGEHALSPGWGSGAVQFFGIHSIPRYILIDKKGNIADPNAKRPSTGQQILQDILMLL